jgi:hypothetical protein
VTDDKRTVPSVSVSYARNGFSTRANALGMRPMQERAYERRGEQYLLIKSPPASGKSRALMFIALDKLANQGVKQAIIVVPEKSIGASFHDEPLSKFGFWEDWTVALKWNLCDAPGSDNGGKVNSLGAFLDSDDKILVCTHATFRFAMDKFGVEKFDSRLIAVDEFHHVSADPDSKLGQHLGALIARDKVHVVAMTGSYFRGDAVPVLAPQDEAKFDTVTYTYYDQLNGYEYLNSTSAISSIPVPMPTTFLPSSTRPRKPSSTSQASIRVRARRTRSRRWSTSSRLWATGRGPTLSPAFNGSRRPMV